jgi:hypothetical protein
MSTLALLHNAMLHVSLTITRDEGTGADWKANLKVPKKDTRVQTEVSIDRT